MKRKACALALLFVLSALVAAAQSPTPQGSKRVAVEDVLAMRGVGAPQWSPDGKWIAFTSHPDPNVWAQKTDLLVVGTEGGQPRNLTAGQSDSVNGPARWSPDGRELFVAASVGVYGQLLRVPAAICPSRSSATRARATASPSRTTRSISCAASSNGSTNT